jgi:hypothetical protein
MKKYMTIPVNAIAKKVKDTFSMQNTPGGHRLALALALALALDTIEMGLICEGYE